MIERTALFSGKSAESLAGAEREFADGRYNNCANRCYYAAFQAAILALLRAGIRPDGTGRWSHTSVPAQFDGQLVNRRKVYPSDLRGVLARNHDLRRRADYADDSVSEAEAARALRRTRLSSGLFTPSPGAPHDCRANRRGRRGNPGRSR